MTILRRLDCVLEPSRDLVREIAAAEVGVELRDVAVYEAHLGNRLKVRRHSRRDLLIATEIGSTVPRGRDVVSPRGQAQVLHPRSRSEVPASVIGSSGLSSAFN